MELRDLPSVDELAREAGDPLAVDAARAVLDARARGDPGGSGSGRSRARACARSSPAHARPRLRRVLNATGVIVHTNLGRAPLAEEALERVAEVARGYSNLEYDLRRGRHAARARTTSRRSCAG